jgi:hypothetical protein
VIRDIEVRHGYTMADLEQMTRAALVADRSMAADIRDRRDAAWSAIAEHLCAAEQPPSRQELIRVGWQAIYREVRDGYRHYGYADRAWDAGHASGPRFVAYWYRPIEPSHEERIVERLAVSQVLTRLSDVYRDAVVALATADDYMGAADLLGISYKALVARIGTARKSVQRLWHEGETPRRLRQTDRRVGSHSVERATHCGNGHEWTPENTYERKRILRGKRHTSRVCKTCEHERSVKRAAASREAKAGAA